MCKKKNIKNNLGAYLLGVSEASCALSVIWENIPCDSYIDDKTRAAMNFISREIHDRHMALDAFLENEHLNEFMSDKDVYAIMAEQRKN
ncbi:hypothetical protein FWP04_14225 [Salmonella enterica subsp. enterica serovar Mountpleasant]|nr:hypothetical protein [Salmonella enterica subsp. enterica serovar Mountpleasant]